jgi:hypothetical protein
MRPLWAGIDAGKTHHHCVVINEDGARLFSKRFANDETEILGILADVLELAAKDAVTWATDLSQGGAALLIALLAGHGQNLLYIPSQTIHQAALSYRGDGKTDATDAGTIADQARMRPDLQPSDYDYHGLLLWWNDTGFRRTRAPRKKPRGKGHRT